MYSHVQRQSWCDCYKVRLERSAYPNVLIGPGSLFGRVEMVWVHYCETCRHYRVLDIDRTCLPLWLERSYAELGEFLDGYRLCNCRGALMNPETLQQQQDRRP